MEVVSDFFIQMYNNVFWLSFTGSCSRVVPAHNVCRFFSFSNMSMNIDSLIRYHADFVVFYLSHCPQQHRSFSHIIADMMIS